MEVVKMNDDLLMTVLLAVGIIAMVLIPFFIVLIFFFLKRRRAKHVLENGVRGTAIVKKLSDTGTVINNIPQIEILLEVTLPNIPTYTIIKRAAVPMIYYPRMQPGMTIDVAADPTRLNDQKYLGILFD